MFFFGEKTVTSRIIGLSSIWWFQFHDFEWKYGNTDTGLFVFTANICDGVCCFAFPWTKQFERDFQPLLSNVTIKVQCNVWTEIKWFSTSCQGQMSPIRLVCEPSSTSDIPSLFLGLTFLEEFKALLLNWGYIGCSLQLVKYFWFLPHICESNMEREDGNNSSTTKLNGVVWRAVLSIGRILRETVSCDYYIRLLVYKYSWPVLWISLSIWLEYTCSTVEVKFTLTYQCSLKLFT